MTRILFIGQKPETIDFSDPALPPGFDAARINAGIATAVQTIEARGWHVAPCMIAPDETGIAEIERQLQGQRFDVVVIGAGLRLPPKSLALFEQVVNAVHRAAPDAAIAFNTHPEDTAKAAVRSTVGKRLFTFSSRQPQVRPTSRRSYTRSSARCPIWRSCSRCI